MVTTARFRIKKMSPQLLVADIGLSIKFYMETLGFDVDFRHEDFYAGIIKNDCSIHLKLGKPSAEERSNKRSNEDLDIVFSVDDIENLYYFFFLGGINPSKHNHESINLATDYIMLFSSKIRVETGRLLIL